MMLPRGPLDARSRAEPGVSTVPWAADQILGVVAVDVIGLGLVVAGWWMASGTAKAGTQVAWLNVSILGLVLSGGANGLWLTRVRRAVTLSRTTVETLIRAAVLADASTVSEWYAPAVPSGNGNGADAGGLVASPAMSYFHRPDCLLAADKHVDAMVRAKHVAAGRRPCEVCQP